jgi:multidrug efflux pump subunit AcrB
MVVRVVETGPPTLIPISLRIVGDDARQLHQEASKLAAIVEHSPLAVKLRDNCGTDVVRGRIQIDQDRAALAGVSGQDLAVSSFSGLREAAESILREGRRNLPMVQVLNYTERPDAATLENLYLYSGNGPGNNITLGQIARILYEAEPGVIQRINQHRAITVSALAKAGHVASEVTAPLEKDIRGFEEHLPPGYRLEIAGEWKEQVKGQKQSAVVALTSSLMIFLALVIQFRSPVKPLIVFSSIPFGAAGALGGVWLMGLPMGFLAILGFTSLIGVIVSHVIVLFDFIEERHDAGIQRIRPLLVTVGATLAALFPLAQHGGPLFEALCWAQIGGLTIATVLTLVLVPVIYAVFVNDLKIVRWDCSPSEG